MNRLSPRPTIWSSSRWATLLLAALVFAGCDLFGEAVDQRAPRVTIDRPIDRAIVSGAHVLVVIDAQPLGQENWISFINVNLEGVRIGEAQAVDGRFRFRWDTIPVADGMYRLEAVAYDKNQSRGISTPVIVQIQNGSVNPGPAFRIVDPIAGKTVSGVVRIVARRLTGPEFPADPVQKVEYLVDGLVVHTETSTPADGISYTFDWDTAGELPGERFLQVKAYSSADAFAISDPVTVIVDQQAIEEGGETRPGSLIGKSAGIHGTSSGSIAVGFNNYSYVSSTFLDTDSGLEVGRVTAFDEAGGLAWTFDAKGPIRRAPVIGNNEDVYAVSEDGRLYALSPLTGSLLWFYQPDVIGFTNPTAASLGVDGVLYFGDSRGYLHAVNTFSGQALTGFPQQITGSTSISIVAAPVITPDRSVVVGDMRGMLTVIAPGLRPPEWVLLGSGIQKPLAVVEETYTLPVPGQIDQRVNSHVVYGVLQNGSIFRVDILDLANFVTSPRPADPIEYPATGPIVGPDGTVYVGTGRSFVAWDRDLRTILYRLPGYRDPLGSASATPHGVSMAAIDANEVIYYLSGETLFAMNSNSTPYWNYDLRTFSPTPPTLTRAGHLLVAGNNGFMFRFETGSVGLAQSMWPMYQRNARHLGRQGIDANDL